MILLGLGSNLKSKFGDRFDNIKLAILYLKNNGINLLKESSFYETLSQPNIEDPKFINSVISIETNLNPVDLASVTIFIEEKLERKRDKKNSPRTCDIDILDLDNKILNFKYKNLIFSVPHEKLIYRNFVLYPLQEVAPNWKHPISNVNISTLIENLSIEDKKSILKIKKP